MGDPCWRVRGRGRGLAAREGVSRPDINCWPSEFDELWPAAGRKLTTPEPLRGSTSRLFVHVELAPWRTEVVTGSHQAGIEGLGKALQNFSRRRKAGRDVLLGVRRFDEMQANLGHRPATSVSTRLERLAEAGVLKKHPYSDGRHDTTTASRKRASSSGRR